MNKKPAPVAALHICQQCSLAPKAKLRNGRKAANPAAQQLTKDLHTAVTADTQLADQLVVRASRCQGMCDNPVAFCLNSTGGEAWQWSNALHGLTVQDILAIAKSYLHHVRTGVRVGKPEWPEGAGKYFQARIPAFPKPAKWVRTKA